MNKETKEMRGTILSKALRVGRAAVFAVGLAVVLAVMLGVATTAMAANGGNFILGQTNVATAITKLAGAAGVNGPMLRIDNNNGANATALDLRVESGKPPMKVNSDAQVANLNADSLDGLDSADFEVGCPAGTQLLGSGCIETASRVQANFDAASEEGNRVMEKERIPYDYLILGAGSAGCTLANRLTEEATFMAEDGSLGLISEGGRFLVSVPEEHAFRAALPGVGNLAYSCLFTLPKNNR